MTYRVLFQNSKTNIGANESLDRAPVVDSLDDVARDVKRAQSTLLRLSIEDIIGLCDAVASSWSKPNHPLAPIIRDLGLGFVPLWMRRQNLELICDSSLHGNRKVLDSFVPLSGGNSRLLRCQPRGLIVHWIAGNVPVLGMISTLQGTLGKNATVVKVSRNDPWLLPLLLDSFRFVRFRTASGDEVTGDVLTNSVAVVYTERDDTKAAVELSTAADVRVAWGGREAVEAIMNLPRRFGTEDIVFGPKVSFIVVGCEYLESESVARKLARNLVRDVAAFDQQGCNSPHTLFLETGGLIHPRQFVEIVGEEMQSSLGRRPLREVQPGDAMNILGIRTEYDMRGDAYYSDGMGWTIVYSDDDEGLAAPCYLRTLFARPIDDVFDVPSYCSLNTQSAGLAVTERRIALADALTQAGVERCPAVGSMSAYDSPWDGMFPLARMVRWVSVHGEVTQTSDSRA